MKNQKIYSLIFTESGDIVDKDSINAFNKANSIDIRVGLYYKLPKKTYTKLHFAKAGFAHLPEHLKPHVSIGEFTLSDIIIDGTSLQSEQDNRKQEREKERQIRIQQYRLEQAERELKKAQELLNDLKTD
jgi:hypothetical protein